eukprot:Clim_evm79s109 gene=Clim_evmTU79s109
MVQASSMARSGPGAEPPPASNGDNAVQWALQVVEPLTDLKYVHGTLGRRCQKPFVLVGVASYLHDLIVGRTQFALVDFRKSVVGQMNDMLLGKQNMYDSWFSNEPKSSKGIDSTALVFHLKSDVDLLLSRHGRQGEGVSIDQKRRLILEAVRALKIAVEAMRETPLQTHTNDPSLRMGNYLFGPPTGGFRYQAGSPTASSAGSTLMMSNPESIPNSPQRSPTPPNSFHLSQQHHHHHHHPQSGTAYHQALQNHGQNQVQEFLMPSSGSDTMQSPMRPTTAPAAGTVTEQRQQASYPSAVASQQQRQGSYNGQDQSYYPPQSAPAPVPAPATSPKPTPVESQPAPAAPAAAPPETHSTNQTPYADTVGPDGCMFPSPSVVRRRLQRKQYRVKELTKISKAAVRPCKNFWVDGFCTRGDDCTFLHDGEDLYCLFYQGRWGCCLKVQDCLVDSCKRFITCNFSHGTEDYLAQHLNTIRRRLFTARVQGEDDERRRQWVDLITREGYIHTP